MTTYAMAIKNGNGLVFKTDANSLEEATNYFAKLKRMQKIEFNKIFIVTAVKQNKNT